MTAFEGPLIVYGTRNAPGQGGTNNPNKAPSPFGQGVGLLDDRAGYNVNRWGCITWMGSGGAFVPLINQAPTALTVTNIAASQTATAGTALTLVSSANSGVTLVASGGVTIWASGNLIPANTLVLDGLPGLITPYQNVTQPSSGNPMVSLYDPTKSISRNVRITCSGDDHLATFLVSGYDLYGYTQTETIAGVTTAVASGKKAFKFITSIVPAGTVSSTALTVGTGDVIGFPLRVNSPGYTNIWWAGTQATVTTNPFGTASAYNFADTTSPATSTTGDPRGTIYLGTATASNGTASRTLQVAVSLDPSAFGAADAIFGVKPA
jgi:hypothetical protein